MAGRKNFMSLVLALVLLFGLTAQASSAETVEEVTAYLNYGITVTYNGDVQTMTDAAGNTVYPLSYNDTAYLPLRAVSSMPDIAANYYS